MAISIPPIFVFEVLILRIGGHFHASIVRFRGCNLGYRWPFPYLQYTISRFYAWVQVASTMPPIYDFEFLMWITDGHFYAANVRFRGSNLGHSWPFPCLQCTISRFYAWVQMASTMPPIYDFGVLMWGMDGHFHSSNIHFRRPNLGDRWPFPYLQYPFLRL